LAQFYTIPGKAHNSVYMTLKSCGEFVARNANNGLGRHFQVRKKALRSPMPLSTFY